ncbi:Ferrous-iron efflux pump FieF [Methylacidimicrobium cyclopophantes]|uniref:Ferrous-iron efflux pump FieF n=1 Tax=Methylacidimicrobium cyclopophantes TaxID=1041766 RepID=A0A5E6MAI5_9BACT|nr:cation diffusion facilitator family transporter [Methylacidimicrobium cyclopophantes]VVM06415.1 Ferrous-iron efflux pump FieF [Methylacidimicrobium cyclopophantes]
MTAAAAGALSLGVGLLILAAKFLAYRLTGSVALYSDALESVVNVAGAAAAFLALRISSAPPDRNHPYGHTKAEYLSAGFEGGLIAVAAALILWEALRRLFAPSPLPRLTEGIAISLASTVVNGALGAYLLDRARKESSPALSADGLHLLTDVVSSLGIVFGLLLAKWTGLWLLDPLLGLVLAGYILWTGYGLMRGSVSGLIDESLSPEIIASIEASLVAEGPPFAEIQRLRSRGAGRAVFVEFALVVPGSLSVREAHELCDRMEEAVRRTVPQASVTVHVEPAEKKESVLSIDRRSGEQPGGFPPGMPP